MLGTLLIIMGIVLTAGSIGVGYYLISLRCSMEGAAGCQASLVKLISDLMIANEGIFFWLAWVIGIFLIWGGMRLRARGG